MKKIITITLNPALDKSIVVPQMTPEKKLHCIDVKIEPGGGGINVSRALHKLGGRSEAIYLSGGFIGKEIEKLLDIAGIRSTVFNIAGSTRENFTVLDASTNLQYRFGMDGPTITKQEWEQTIQYIYNIKDVDYMIISGSLPPGIPVDYFSKLALAAKEKQAKLIVDTSGTGLEYAVKQGVFMIKPNLHELSSLYGKENLAPEEVVAAGKHIIEKGGAAVVVVSMGADGAMLITDKEDFHMKPPMVAIQSTVGAGDSMVAGMMMALNNEWPWKEVLCYGVAAGTAATMNSGTGLCKKEDVDQIFEKIRQK